MSSKGGTALPRRNYRLTSETDKPKAAGIVNEKLLSDYLHQCVSRVRQCQITSADLYIERDVRGEKADTQRVSASVCLHVIVFDRWRPLRKTLTFQNLGAHLEKLLSEDNPSEDGRGRPSSHTGSSAECRSDEQSAQVTGKWVYEVLISSQGLMQIGWCTFNCRFNQEEGVGDTPDSYAYDGNRVRKWNVTTTNYGKCKVYLVEDVLMNFLLSVLEGGGSVDEHPLIQQLLDLSWLLMEDYEVNECLKQLMMSLLRAYRFSPIIPDLGFQGKDERDTRDETADERLRRRAYERGCQRLKKRIEVVEELQVQILRLMLNNNDKGKGEASRYIFLNKLRKFLQENASNRGLFYNGKVDYFDLQRLGGLLSHLKKTLKDDLASKANIIIDPAEIQAASMDDLDEDDETGAAQRPSGAAAMGGAMARPSWLSSPTLGRANRFLSTAAVSLMTPRRSLAPPEKVKVRTLAVEQRTEEDIEGSHGNDGLLLGRPLEEPDQPITEKSLLEILDGVMMMYNLSVHQQLGKMVVVSDDVHEYAIALKDTEEKIARCPSIRPDILEELQKSQKVFAEKLNHLSRRLAWINATIYSKEKMSDVYWLLRVCIRTIEHADNTGSLFAFMPEFYLNVAMNSYSALKNYFSPSNCMEELPGYEETLTQLATILSKHFADPRIVGTDIKDSLMQALASYVCYPQSLRAVERIPEEQRVAMMRNLLAPYEQRPWAQTNWILVRLWRGCGFGYRYTRLPHLLKTKPEDANLPSLQKPCPSLLLQKHMSELLSQDKDMAASFLNSVLNQLNWAFSEFIGMIQEIQQAAERPERNFVDTRQLKVCATCFDLSVSLLRVLEMTITLVPQIFLDWSRPSAELLLRRLAQLLNQVLNRVTAERNLFDRVVNLRLPGLESVDHYPILVAVTGILVRILVDSDKQGMTKHLSLVCSDKTCSFHFNVIRLLLFYNVFRKVTRKCRGLKLKKHLFHDQTNQTDLMLNLAHDITHKTVNEEIIGVTPATFPFPVFLQTSALTQGFTLPVDQGARRGSHHPSGADKWVRKIDYRSKV
ncbi:E3 ubiquitin-protein ligase RNF123 [Triplophysa tibetana]|uniref:E3 ubiquitin-protein ligase RNF123 n=1 Tax=Triplophysa tibetana TaxID=1572043 RepID=A0A5A9NU25_9TELE|nr:E3 ubiquitin-protein ligase RNF123 [Triplophysa tibetana]